MGYDDLSEFTIEVDDENLILLYGKNKDFGVKHYHYAFDDLDYYLNHTEKKTDFLMTFVDDSLIENLKTKGFEIFGKWRDYFNPDISSFIRCEEYKHLKEADYNKASDITMACKGQSRGFMGQTKEWVAEWMRGENKDVSDRTILTHSIDGEIVGIICVGIYAHDSDKGAVLWVRELAGHPKFQRMGIAANLMDQGLCYGKENGAKRAFLSADDLNAGAIHLYEKMGFVGNENDYEVAMYKKAYKKEV